MKWPPRNLFKLPIVYSVMLTGGIGYLFGYRVEVDWSFLGLLHFLLSIGSLAAGSLALNQYQERSLDGRMARTRTRPIPAGQIRPREALSWSIFFISLGALGLVKLSLGAVFLGLLTVLLYNGFYTLILKPKYSYAAVPGAIPGALPVAIGYAVHSNPLQSECVYLFLVMFLWQMPHFWSLAIRYSADYAAAGIPVLPATAGVRRTKFMIGAYTAAFLLLPIFSPFFVHTSWLYIVSIGPIVFFVMRELLIFAKAEQTGSWFRFFMAVNASMLVFLIVPLVEKWSTLLFDVYGAG